MLSRWTQRLQSTWTARGRRPAGPNEPQPAATPQRTEICPPDRLYRHSRWRGGLRDWLNTGWEVSAPATPMFDRAAVTPVAESDPLPFADIRQEFAQVLDDIDTDPAAEMRAQIEQARSPRDLWHLRSALYTLVATHHSESQAQLRFDRLNRHFPRRTKLSGLGAR